MLSKDEDFIRWCWGGKVMLAGSATNYNDLAVLDNNRWQSR